MAENPVVAFRIHRPPDAEEGIRAAGPRGVRAEVVKDLAADGNRNRLGDMEVGVEGEVGKEIRPLVGFGEADAGILRVVEDRPELAGETEEAVPIIYVRERPAAGFRLRRPAAYGA